MTNVLKQELDWIPLTEEEPSPGITVLLTHPEAGRPQGGTHISLVEWGDDRYVDLFERGFLMLAHWAPLPELDDARWRSMPFVPAMGETVLVKEWRRNRVGYNLMHWDGAWWWDADDIVRSGHQLSWMPLPQVPAPGPRRPATRNMAAGQTNAG